MIREDSNWGFVAKGYCTTLPMTSFKMSQVKNITGPLSPLYLGTPYLSTPYLGTLYLGTPYLGTPLSRYFPYLGTPYLGIPPI